MDSRILDIVSTKPELITDFPEWMLPRETIDRLRETSGTAIVEIAGRDSFAAAVQATRTGEFTALLPTIAYTGTQFGDWRTPFEKASLLAEVMGSRGIQVFEPVLLGAPRIWRLLCGRFSASHAREFGFYSQCLGCHLYFHAIRIPLARTIRSTVIISGERESHDGRIKVNQIGVALDAYVRLLSEFGIELRLPLRHISSNEEIESILGQPWEEGAQQLECVLSKNYIDPAGNVMISESAIRRYFDEYALKTAREAIAGYLGKSVT